MYARYSTDFQHSVVDQVRTCLEDAVRLGFRVRPADVHVDLAVSGKKSRRPGLDALKAGLAKKRVAAVLVMTTNRLFRKMYKCLQFVEEELVERGVRCVFVKTGLDSADAHHWKMQLQLHAMMDEHGTVVYAANIRAAHEGLFDKGFVVSTLPFGYHGLTVDGPPTKRQRPRQAVAVHDAEAAWVRTIFQWFVADRLPMAAILRRLNTAAAPLPPKAGGYWTLAALRYLLENAAYRGEWAYGKGQNVWQSKADYSKRVLRDQPLKVKQFDHLRLVDDATWHGAQRLLAEHPRRGGRKPRDGDRKSRPRVLNGLLVCAAHGDRLKVSGDKGQWMVCPVCRTLPKADRPLHTYLPRALATRRVCEAVAGLLLEDADLAGKIAGAARAAAAAAAAPDPAAGRDLRARLDRLDRQVKFLVANPGETDEDQAESKAQLQTWRRERAAAQAELARLDGAAAAAAPPTEDQVRQVVADLAVTLGTAADAEDEAAAGRLRAALELATGGEIRVRQAGEKKRHKGWLVGVFQPRLLDLIAGRLPAGVALGGGEGLTVEVAFRQDVSIAEKKADAVKELVDQGLLYTEIAARLGMERHQVRDSHRVWNARHGLPAPDDGRARRGDVPNGNMAPTKAMLLADEVKALYDRGLLLDQIAAEVGADRGTVRRALKTAFDRLGQVMPDGRNRRKTLDVKNRPKTDPPAGKAA